MNKPQQRTHQRRSCLVPGIINFHFTVFPFDRTNSLDDSQRIIDSSEIELHNNSWKYYKISLTSIYYYSTRTFHALIILKLCSRLSRQARARTIARKLQNVLQSSCTLWWRFEVLCMMHSQLSKELNETKEEFEVWMSWRSMSYEGCLKSRELDVCILLHVGKLHLIQPSVFTNPWQVHKRVEWSSQNLNSYFGWQNWIFLWQYFNSVAHKVSQKRKKKIQCHIFFIFVSFSFYTISLSKYLRWGKRDVVRKIFDICDFLVFNFFFYHFMLLTSVKKNCTKYCSNFLIHNKSREIWERISPLNIIWTVNLKRIFEIIVYDSLWT